MPRALYIPARSSHARRNARNKHLPFGFRSYIQLIRSDAAPRRHRAPEVLAAHTKMLRERGGFEVMRPNEERTLGGGTAEKIMT